MAWKLLDCSKYTPNCTAKNQLVNANPDIAGRGVILGFLCTTCLAFLIAFAVLFLQRYARLRNWCRKLFTKHQGTYEHDESEEYWRSPYFWERVLSKNLLAFSDTQLLTGLAIQFTAMLQHCKLSIYHFQIVTELAFLTTVTHLLCVVTLRNYFVKYKWVNLPRIICMLGNLALLGYTSFVAYSYDLAGLDLSASLACFYKGNRPPFRAAFGGRWAALLIGAIGGHVTVILVMYFIRDETLERANKRKWWSWLLYLGALFRTWIIVPVYATYGIIMGGLSLRKTQALGKPSVNINGSEKEWGFGQFLPLLLLALPLFAGWESFWEEKDWQDDDRYGPGRGGSRSRSRSTVNALGIIGKTPGAGTYSPRDNSVIEMNIQSNGPSPYNTPRMRSTSRVSISPNPSPMPTQGLAVPSPVASPAIGQQRSRSTSYTGSPLPR
ncbi:hypothetical protein BDV96DRAFT_488032 [Lophiotrema nucula]|uniref:Uncharacterized protein n=1 Tax=Lophiotrema nucula TaxID=690887 RepID=A0A6A5ZIC7_9PLEO|nr:hypothetical protein BDV96DRAFT_488032 [Lophiotrema nucula]